MTLARSETAHGHTPLPVADGRTIRAFVVETARRHRTAFGWVILLHGVAAASGLAAPWLVGLIVDGVVAGTPATHINLLLAAIVGAAVAHGVMSYASIAASIRLGERLLAEIRERFVESVLRLPLRTVERAGTGDLVARTGRDVGQMAEVARTVVPEGIIAVVTLVLAVGAIGLVTPWGLLPLLVAVTVTVWGTRRFVQRAPAGYDREMLRYAEVTQRMADTVDGARTVEALRRATRQARRTDASIAAQYAAERYTLRLRMEWYTALEASYVVPLTLNVLFCGWLYMQDLVSLGQATAVVLYMQSVKMGLDRLDSEVDRFMESLAAMRRLLGVRQAEDTEQGQRRPSRPAGSTVELRDVRFGYEPDTEVLHGIDLDVRAGERLALVGPSGSGKSTLARLVAGIHPPRSGSVLVGGEPIEELALAEQRRRVALVTQETHVFRGTVADNVAMARDGAADPAQVWAALAAVGADAWVRALPEGLDTAVGAGRLALDPARVQQLALARLVLADPPVVVLDEATSLFDAESAREVERSLAGVLRGRTVIAIAHRLHIARMADRVAVVVDGRVSELGSHAELLDRGGPYARLWRAWQG